MSRKGIVDVFQTKTTRNDRYAQMSHQEKLIEQKKREIQAKVEQKRKSGNSEKSEKNKDTKSYTKSYNQFSNDGSFMDQFKQMKDKKIDQKLKSFKFSQEKSHSEDRNRNNRWSHRRRSPSPISSRHKFSDKFQNNEPKISISTSYTNFISQANFNVQTSQSIITPENAVGQPLLKNDQSSSNVTFPPPTQTSTTVISALPLMLNAPPPPIIQQNAVLMQQPALPSTAVITSEIRTPTIITSLSLPPPTSAIGPQNAPDLTGATLPVLGPENALNIPTLRSMTSVELASIPSPNPLQLQSIPQPEPINTMNIPPPAPLQVQNIPPPSSIQLNEIPKPKPIDIINIPTPTEVATNLENSMSDPDFIKNIPPPNKSIPPPSIQDTTISANISVPPPDISNPGPTCMPPPNVSSQNIPPPPSLALLPPSPQSVPPPLPQSVSSLIISENVGQSVMTPQTIIVHSVPPPSQNIQSLQLLSPSSTIQNVSSQLPLQTVSQTLPPTPVIPVTLTLQSGTEVSNATETNVIISQQLLQGNPGQISVATPNLNIHYPPPIVNNNIQGLQQTFITQPPPITNHTMPPMNIPPPASIPNSAPPQEIKSLQAVYSSGTAEYEAMVSLGRMVAQCGPGIEDIVRQRKQQDPHLWFLFHKESAPYRQYQQLVEQFSVETEREKKEFRNAQQNENNLMKGENSDLNEKDNDQDSGAGKRRRRSRWGDKDQKMTLPTMMMVGNSNASVTPTSIPINIAINPVLNVLPPVPVVCPQKSQGPVLLTSLTRNDPAFIQYVKQTYGSVDLTEEDWKKAEDNFKVSLLYQEMLKKKQEAERLAKTGKHKYDYDSDEETDGGTWEHKLREKEMQKTQTWAVELTKNAEGKHHIGDFLPPEELQKFLDKKGKGPNDGSDYKDFKIKEDNIGFKMLQKLGWSEGQGLGATASGIVEPVNKALVRDQNQGLGLASSAVEENDDEYESYRKRMMLAYRFRPNPLNNPRRPYY
ncbi:activating transcription factor 7-interacting protein 1 isoform X2 [Agrilus planipennis]|uniref:Activating transcription factor 7-interacting protein 1 isoform X2 n=1 Tax=Agrilus planipennis TaxID=224129 RepID=A0A1W4WGS1_AGRPL|nr:activating transcription factor 7-interacting protein 1 isoform X2 [Agrilus planipennis]